jgi:hypothetical protein
MRIEAWIGDLVRRIRDNQTQVGYSVARRLGGRLTSCVICIIHVEKTRSASFPVWPQIWWQWFCLKTTVMIFLFRPQNQGRWFCDLDIKITVTISWFGPQNQVGWSLSVCTSKPMSKWRRYEDTRRHPTTYFIVKQVGLGFSNFASKLENERWWEVHVASSWRSCESEAKDECFIDVGCGAVEVRPNYHLLDVIFLLVHRGILVFLSSL